MSAAAAAGVTGDVWETYEAWAMISGHQRFPEQPMLPRRPLLSPTDHRRTNNKISTVTTYPRRLHCLIAIRGGPARGGSRLPLSFPPSLPPCLPHSHHGQQSTRNPQLLPQPTGAALVLSSTQTLIPACIIPSLQPYQYSLRARYHSQYLLNSSARATFLLFHPVSISDNLVYPM